MLEVRPLPAILPASADAVLLTSGNAVPHLPAWAKNRPIFAVGDATAALARGAGFPTVRSADGDACALGEAVRRSLPSGAEVLLLSGKGQGTRLAATLTAAGWPVIRAEVYDAVPATALPAEVTQMFRSGAVHAALFFSARTADTFVTLARKERLDTPISKTIACAIGPPAGVALQRIAWRQIRIAAHPNQDGILALLP